MGKSRELHLTGRNTDDMMMNKTMYKLVDKNKKEGLKVGKYSTANSINNCHFLFYKGTIRFS